MLCDQTAMIVADYFDKSLSAAARAGIDRHLEQCPDCKQEVLAMQTVVTNTLQWQEQTVPEWNRASVALPLASGSDIAGYGKRSDRTGRRFSSGRWSGVSVWWQWGPLAASLLMAIAVIFDLQISSNDNGFNVAFGQSNSVLSSAAIAEQWQILEQQQRAETLAMMQVVLQEFGDSNAENLSRIVAYFEQQRQLDMQLMQAGYQQLIDSDYETIRSVRQLASYVQYQDGL